MSNIDSAQLQSSTVICLGEALVDRLGPLGGDLALVHSSEDCFGGAPANVACGLAKLGSKVAFVGRLGKDHNGQGFQTLMRARGINLLALQTDSLRPTRVVLVSRDLEGERAFQGFYGDIGQGFSDQALDVCELKTIWTSLVNDAKWLLLGTIPLATNASSEALIWSVNEASKAGIKLALDVNWRPTFWDINAEPESGPNKRALEIIGTLLEKVSFLKTGR